MAKKSGENILLKKSFAFAVRTVNLYKYLSTGKKEYVISKQMLRSGTAVGAMVREAQNAESTKDFIHKLGLAQKENDETLYWLELLKETEYLNEVEFADIWNDGASLLKIIKSAILTTKENQAIQNKKV